MARINLFIFTRIFFHSFIYSGGIVIKYRFGYFFFKNELLITDENADSDGDDDGVKCIDFYVDYQNFGILIHSNIKTLKKKIHLYKFETL